MKKNLPEISSAWTLFLDRDGVINERKIDGYIDKVEDFKFCKGSLNAIAKFGTFFGRIIVVTNQQGIDKSIMTHEQLNVIHSHMVDVVLMSGGRIDQIYYCPHLNVYDCTCRKPNPGMAIIAKSEFPEIDFRKSIMIGDTESDIEFGNRLKMKTIRISNVIDSDADFTFDSLDEFSIYLNNKN
ncbi:MAG: HAD-IIIA family hydrolase [Saprospiraceae bacterium]